MVTHSRFADGAMRKEMAAVAYRLDFARFIFEAFKDHRQEYMARFFSTHQTVARQPHLSIQYIPISPVVCEDLIAILAHLAHVRGHLRTITLDVHVLQNEEDPLVEDVLQRQVKNLRIELGNLYSKEDLQGFMVRFKTQTLPTRVAGKLSPLHHAYDFILVSNGYLEVLPPRWQPRFCKQMLLEPLAKHGAIYCAGIDQSSFQLELDPRKITFLIRNILTHPGLVTVLVRLVSLALRTKDKHVSAQRGKNVYAQIADILQEEGCMVKQTAYSDTFALTNSQKDKYMLLAFLSMLSNEDAMALRQAMNDVIRSLEEKKRYFEVFSFNHIYLDISQSDTH